MMQHESNKANVRIVITHDTCGNIAVIYGIILPVYKLEMAATISKYRVA